MTTARPQPKVATRTEPESLRLLQRVGYASFPYAIVVVLCVLIVIPAWHLRGADLSVPLGTISDYNVSQAMVANFVRDGHWYVSPLLGAPGEQELYDYPLPHWTHVIFLAVIRLITRDPAFAINLMFFVSYPLVAVTSLYAFRRLGISTGLAIAAAVLYTFIPFHQLRNEGHLIYSCYYIVPLVAMVGVWVSTGHDLFRLGRRNNSKSGLSVSRDGFISLVICVLIGWDNAYYAFFAVAMLAVGALLGWLRHGDRRALLTGIVLIGVVAASLGVVLLPNYLYFHQNGRLKVAQRIPVESETYALTLIQLLAPVTNHRIPALANWKNSFNSQALLINENDQAALGVVGAVGLLSLLICLFVMRCPETLYSLSVMNLFCLLLGTMGGFGAVFSFVISPQLRGFNRISVYISFFCIAAVVLILDLLTSRWSNKPRQWAGMVIFPALLMLIGVPDQFPRGLMSGRKQIEAEFKQEGRFISQIERLMPPHGMVFQLPYFPFPETGPIHDITDYEELKGYLHSASLRWSYGAMKGRDTDQWLAAVSRQPVGQMVHSVVAAEFAGIYIDRFGYTDRAAALEAQLRSLLGNDPIVSEGGRLSFFLLNENAIASLNRQITPEQRVDLEYPLRPLVVEAGDGCEEKERNASGNFYWCARHGELTVINHSKSRRVIMVDANLASGFPAGSDLVIDWPGVEQTFRISGAGRPWQAQITVPAGRSAISFSSDSGEGPSPAARPEKVLRVSNFRFHEAGQ